MCYWAFMCIYYWFLMAMCEGIIFTILHSLTITRLSSLFDRKTEICILHVSKSTSTPRWVHACFETIDVFDRRPIIISAVKCRQLSKCDKGNKTPTRPVRTVSADNSNDVKTAASAPLVVRTLAQIRPCALSPIMCAQVSVCASMRAQRSTQSDCTILLCLMCS